MTAALVSSLEFAVQLVCLFPTVLLKALKVEPGTLFREMIGTKPSSLCHLGHDYVVGDRCVQKTHSSTQVVFT